MIHCEETWDVMMRHTGTLYGTMEHCEETLSYCDIVVGHCEKTMGNFEETGDHYYGRVRHYDETMSIMKLQWGFVIEQ